MLYAAVAGLLGYSMTASANFSGYYAPSQWAIVHVPDAFVDFGAVDTTGQPTSILLIGSDSQSGEGSSVEFTITAPAAGTFSFDWSYTTFDGGFPGTPTPFWDPAGYVLNNLVQLTNDNGPNTQSGHFSGLVAQGDLIGFYVTTVDNSNGNATLNIVNFSAPAAVSVPEPPSLAMVVLGLFGLAGATAARRRRPI